MQTSSDRDLNIFVMSPFIEDSEHGFGEDENENKMMVKEGTGQLDIVQLLTQVAETYDLPSVQFIKLKIMTKDLPLHSLNVYLPGLKELDLDSSNINSLRELGAEMGGLQVLRINKCRLDSLDGILSFKNLKEFSASNNYITNVGLIGQLEHLQYLDISRNFISGWQQLSFLKECDNLAHLKFQGNPGSTLINYKEEVKKILPQLITLDGVPVDSSNINNVPPNAAGNQASKPKTGEDKLERKFTLNSNFCGNIATALVQTKKQQKQKEEEMKLQNLSKNIVNEDSKLLLSAAEEWKKIFKSHLKERTGRPY